MSERIGSTDYEDFLRQRGDELWPPEYPALICFKALRCRTLDDVRAWVRDERREPKPDGVSVADL